MWCGTVERCPASTCAISGCPALRFDVADVVESKRTTFKQRCSHRTAEGRGWRHGPSPRMSEARLPRPAGPGRGVLAHSASCLPRPARPHPPRPQTCRASCRAFGGNKGRRPPEFGRRGFRCCRALGCPPASPSCSLATTHPAASPRPPARSTRRISALEAAGARGCEPMKLQQWLAPQAGGGGWKGAHKMKHNFQPRFSPPGVWEGHGARAWRCGGPQAASIPCTRHPGWQRHRQIPHSAHTLPSSSRDGGRGTCSGGFRGGEGAGRAPTGGAGSGAARRARLRRA